MANEQDLQVSFGEILKREFGTGVPQIATVIAIVIGSLGLKDFFDAGAWTVVAVFSFAGVFLYRHQIPSRLPTTTWIILVFVVSFASLAAAIYYFTSGKLAFLNWVAQNKSAASAYCSLVTSVSVACLITSFRKQERMLGRSYPPAIDKAIVDQLHALDFYKQDVRFLVTVENVSEGMVVFVTELSYVVVNRSDSKRSWNMEYKLNRTDGKVLGASFDGHELDVQDPNYLTDIGIRIPRQMNPGQRSRVQFKVREGFRVHDSELYTSYHPATDLALIVLNQFEILKIRFEVLHFSEPALKIEKELKSIALSYGVLPFQGIRMHWSYN